MNYFKAIISQMVLQVAIKFLHYKKEIMVLYMLVISDFRPEQGRREGGQRGRVPLRNSHAEIFSL